MGNSLKNMLTGFQLQTRCVHQNLVGDREKTMRGLKKTNTPILKGYQIFHNYVRPHEGLGGKTPAEACGIKVEGQNKWITIIENASKKIS